MVLSIITSIYIFFFFAIMEQTFSKIHFIKTAFHKKMEHDILIDSLILYTKKEIEANLILYIKREIILKF